MSADTEAKLRALIGAALLAESALVEALFACRIEGMDDLAGRLERGQLFLTRMQGFIFLELDGPHPGPDAAPSEAA